MPRFANGSIIRKLTFFSVAGAGTDHRSALTCTIYRGVFSSRSLRAASRSSITSDELTTRLYPRANIFNGESSGLGIPPSNFSLSTMTCSARASASTNVGSAKSPNLPVSPERSRGHGKQRARQHLPGLPRKARGSRSLKQQLSVEKHQCLYL